jgi:hypothetical protein
MGFTNKKEETTMFSTKIPRPTPSLEARILRVTSCDELAEIAAEALSAEHLNFSDAQFELLLEQLGEMDEARLVMRLALCSMAKGERPHGPEQESR